jgi:D-3-phosphoglycerate dehydrogenase
LRVDAGLSLRIGVRGYEITTMRRRPKLLIAETDGFSPSVLEALEAWAEVHPDPVAPGRLGAALGEYDIVWTKLAHRLAAADFPEQGRCRILAIPATGLDHIDLEACERAGIRVASLRGEVEFLRDVRATAEHALALALALLRRLPAAHRSVVQGAWDRDAFRGRELYGKTVGLVGMGRLGSIVAGYCRAFGMAVQGYDPRPDFPGELARRCDSLAELMSTSDVISLHVAYHAGTRHLIDAEHLALVRRSAVLINTSRGGVIDDAALLAALVDGRLSGAALDVVAGEPDVGAGHPLVRYARAHDNLILTPHIGGNTVESVAKTEAFIAEKVRQMWLEEAGEASQAGRAASKICVKSR